MINKLANKIVRHYISKNKIEKEHEEVYVYSFELLISYGTIIVRGGNGGSNDDPNYQNHKGGNGGAATINITISSPSISATLENGLIGESTNYYDPDDYFN